MNNMLLAGIGFLAVPVLWIVYKTITNEEWRDAVLNVVIPILMAVSLAIGISLLVAGLTK